MTRAQLADVEREFIGPYLPIGEYGPCPVWLRQQHLCRCGIKAVIPGKRDQAASRKRKGRKGGRPVDHEPTGRRALCGTGMNAGSYDPRVLRA